MWSAFRRALTIEWLAFALAFTGGATIGAVALGMPLLSVETLSAFGITVGLAVYAALFSARYKRL